METTLKHKVCRDYMGFYRGFASKHEEQVSLYATYLIPT